MAGSVLTTRAGVGTFTSFDDCVRAPVDVVLLIRIFPDERIVELLPLCTVASVVNCSLSPPLTVPEARITLRMRSGNLS